MIIKYHSKEGYGDLIKNLTLTKNKIIDVNFSMFTYSREAISQIMKYNNIKKNDKILMPSYQCNTVIDYILPFTENIVFYNIDDNLYFDTDQVISLLDKDIKMIFFVHYFGVIQNIDKKLITILEKKNIIIVQDLAHCFFTLYNKNFSLNYKSDYIVSSVYKNLQLGVGAVCIGDLPYTNGIDLKEFILINLKRYFTHMRCMVGKRRFTYFDLNDKSCNNENIVIYKKNKILSNVYTFLISHINIDKIIETRELLAIKYYEKFEKSKIFENLFTKHIIQNNTLQVYPVKCMDKAKREEIFIALKKECIDVYPWPSYHCLNSYDVLKDKLLLFPLDDFAISRIEKVLKEIENE